MEKSLSHRERRRKRNLEAFDVTESNLIENVERKIESNSQSCHKLFRRDTYVLYKAKSDSNVVSSRSNSDELNVSSIESFHIKDREQDVSGLTYNINDDSKHDTFNVEKSKGALEDRPVPAPRRIKFTNVTEKTSSDTDRDVAEIDLDEIRIKSDTDSKSPKSKITSMQNVSQSSGRSSVITPVPKPRKKKLQIANSSNVIDKSPEFSVALNNENQKDFSKHEEEEVKINDVVINEMEKVEKSEIPLVENIKHEYVLKSEKAIEEKLKKEKKLKISDLVEKKKDKKKSKKKLTSLMKLEKAKIPKISFISKDVKESDVKIDDEDEDNVDFQVDSPRYPLSAENGRIYVQNKYGFSLMKRDQVLNAENSKEKDDGTNNKIIMEESTVKTAILFQKYWSRMMMFFHGILAGLACCHALIVTVIILRLNYNPTDFINFYSSLSLKIHYIFYILTTFSIVSCFDRIDIGHINKKHWETAWKVPSMWSILCVYIASFLLTFINHKTEARFDSYLYMNDNDTDMKIWNTRVPNEIQVNLLTWFHIVWARDILLIVAWLIISMTKFSDFLCGHLNNMKKYAQINSEGKN